MMQKTRHDHIFGPYNRGLRAEFLPHWLQYGLVYICCTWRALRSGSPLFMTATNPGFPLGGLFPSSKKHTLDQLPDYCVPRDIVVTTDNLENIQKKIHDARVLFPLIIKPNEGLRGMGIIICHDQSDRDEKVVSGNYFDNQGQRGSWIVQDFIEKREEYGIFYVRMPGQKSGKITGIVQRDFPVVMGDGKCTLEELVHADTRMRYRYDSFERDHYRRRSEIIPVGESIALTEIGNHSRGTTFYDMSHLITADLETEIDTISQHIDGFYYGRYDIKADGIQAIVDQDYAVLELNATYAEPTRMYDPCYNYIQAMKILLYHWLYIYRIAKENHKNGISYATKKEYFQASRLHRGNLSAKES